MSDRNPDSWNHIISYCDNVSLAGLWISGDKWMQDKLTNTQQLACSGRYFPVLSNLKGFKRMLISNTRYGNIVYLRGKVHYNPIPEKWMLQLPAQLESLTVNIIMGKEVASIIDALPRNLLHFNLTVFSPIFSTPVHSSVNISKLPISLNSLTISAVGNHDHSRITWDGARDFPQLTLLSININYMNTLEQIAFRSLLQNAPNLTTLYATFNNDEGLYRELMQLDKQRISLLSLAGSGIENGLGKKLKEFTAADIELNLGVPSVYDELICCLPSNVTRLACRYHGISSESFSHLTNLRLLTISSTIQGREFDVKLPQLHTLDITSYSKVTVPPTVTNLSLTVPSAELIHDPHARYHVLECYAGQIPAMNSCRILQQLTVLRITSYHPAVTELLQQLPSKQLRVLSIRDIGGSQYCPEILFKICQNYTALQELALILTGKSELEQVVFFPYSITRLSIMCRSASHHLLSLPPYLTEVTLDINWKSSAEPDSIALFMAPLDNILSSFTIVFDNTTAKCNSILNILKLVPLCTPNITIATHYNTQAIKLPEAALMAEKVRRKHYLAEFQYPD